MIEAREYIAVGPGCWGKGENKPDAIKEMKKRWPTFTKTGTFDLWSCPPGSKVGEFGAIAYPANAKTPPIKVSTGTIGGAFGVTGRSTSPA